MHQERLARDIPTLVWIDVGAMLFIVALIVSAVMVPELRPLHVLQGMIYVAVIVLAHRNSSWGLGAGFFIAIVWNSFSLFVTHLIQTGLVAFWTSVHTGHVQQFVPMMVALGGLGHFVLIVATLTACVRQPEGNRKWLKFVGGGVLTVAYFALIVAFARPH